MEDQQYSLNSYNARLAQVDYNNYKACNTRKPFDRVPFDISVRLGEDHPGAADISLNVYRYSDNPGKSALNQTCELSLCSLTADASLFAEFDKSALFLTVSCANGSMIGTGYQFKLISAASGIPGKLVFLADSPSFIPFSPFPLNSGYLRICDLVGPIPFRNPYGRTSSTANVLDITEPVPIVGDTIVIKKSRGVVMAVGASTFTISWQIPDGVVDFYLPRLDLDIHMRAVGMIPY